jgi:Zinc finger, C3HC4 type (RING finger)
MTTTTNNDINSTGGNGTGGTFTSNSYNEDDNENYYDSTSSSSGPILVRPNHVPDDLICSICHSVPIQPIVLQPCEHLYCSYCIHQSFIHVGKQCPIDRINCTTEQILPLRENTLAYRLWCSIQVQCTETMNGCNCTWSGSVLDYAKSHRYKCQLNERLIIKRQQQQQQQQQKDNNDKIGSTNESSENTTTGTSDEEMQKQIYELVYDNNQLKVKIEQLANQIREMNRIESEREQDDVESGPFDLAYYGNSDDPGAY